MRLQLHSEHQLAPRPGVPSISAGFPTVVLLDCAARCLLADWQQVVGALAIRAQNPTNVLKITSLVPPSAPAPLDGTIWNG